LSAREPQSNTVVMPPFKPLDSIARWTRIMLFGSAARGVHGRAGADRASDRLGQDLVQRR
jgi:hypothetical protein